jgi:hypothetical protein
MDYLISTLIVNINLIDDIYNKELFQMYDSIINNDSSYVPGTMFFCKQIAFDKVTDFFIKNNRSFLLNNLYENNSINKNFSPVHFLERLFGVIKL